jgi:ribonucleotide reductase alpha subunit
MLFKNNLNKATLPIHKVYARLSTIMDLMQQGNNNVMRVQKRDGMFEVVSFDKVINRMRVLSNDLKINIHEIAQKVCSRIFDGVKTSDLDELAAQMCSSLIVEHPDYGILASRIIVSNHHKNTSPSFSETVTTLWNNVDVHGNPNPLVSAEFYRIVMANKEKLNSYIDYQRDYIFDYFGFKTLERAYLTKIGNATVERPQHLFMRVAIGIHGDDIKDALQTYDGMSTKKFIHATPTLFNSGTPVPQQSSCYLLHMKDDSITGIFETLGDCAMISKYAGGIGLNIHQVRARGSLIRGTNGKSDGIIPMLRVFNNTARYVNQSGRRNGSIAVYLEPWHADVEGFLDLKKNHGNEEERCRDLFYAMWIPDLFMERVQQNEPWSLMCPDECPGLSDTYGDDFKRLYEKYESERRYRKQVPAQDIWFKILQSQIETGTPYMLYKDAANIKSNQKNLGTIKSSNLCTEIVEYTEPDEIAVCNLASICLPSFVVRNPEDDTMTFSFANLHAWTKIVTKNLNKVIDNNFYPVDKTARSNFKHRPIGIGIQGLADTFVLMRMPFDSVEARQLNKDIFETMYHASLEQSMEIAKRREELIHELQTIDLEKDSDRVKHIHKHLNLKECEQGLTKYPGAYSSFEGSPAQQGVLQFDMWNVQPSHGRYDWDKLKEDIQAHGLRNSLMLAPMPTASTSQIMGFNECFEPFTSNLYKRKTLAGEFIVVNKYLIDDLIRLNLWSKEMKERIIIQDGSIQEITEIPEDVRLLYKTVWEIKQKVILDMAADRGAFICQSQSMNVFMESPDYKKLSSLHFYAWKSGLKTGMYYLRTKPKAVTQQFTIDPRKSKSNIEKTVPEKEQGDDAGEGASCDWSPGCLTCSA